MKITRPSGSAKGNAPARTGGYDYSTSKAQNDLFNQGLDTASAGAADPSYDYSAKGRAVRIANMQGNHPAKIDQTGYSAKSNAENMLRRQGNGLNTYK